MLSDIAKILETLLKAVGAARSPERKRGRLSKQLLEIYSALRGVSAKDLRRRPSSSARASKPSMVLASRPILAASDGVTSNGTSPAKGPPCSSTAA